MRALILTGKFVQDSEFIYPYYRLQEAGFKIDVAAVGGSYETIKGIIGSKIPVNLNFDGMKRIEKKEGYDLLIIPGGVKCLEYLRQEQEALDFIKTFYQKGKLIATICHGTQMLISSIDLSGANISGYYSIADDIRNAGATYHDDYYRHGNIITASHYKYLPQWMTMIMEAFDD